MLSGWGRSGLVLGNLTGAWIEKEVKGASGDRGSEEQGEEESEVCSKNLDTAVNKTPGN